MFKNRRYISIILVLLLSVSLFGCTRKNKSAAAYLMRQKQESVQVSSEKYDDSIFCDTTSFNALKRISRTDMAALCFSEDSNSVSVYDSGSGKIWRSLPEEYGNEKTGVICITVLIDGNEYLLNSQSDSFGQGNSSYEVKEDSIVISYSFRTSLDDGTKIDLTVPVEFKGADGTMIAEIDCSKLEKGDSGKNVVLKSISLLPYFGAFKKGINGDFIVIPDGCGALVDSSSNGKTKESYTVKVYGADPSQGEGEEAFATIPAFGLKSGDGAIAAVIDEGAAISEIKAETASKTEGFNRIYPEFEITPTMKNEDGSHYVSDVSYEGKIKVSYRFLSKDSADYIGMAGACRELLIRSGALSGSNIDIESEYPFNLNLIGFSDVTDSEGKTKQEVLCDFSQSYDILQNLKAKDINSINLKYKGIFDGGTKQEDISEAELLSVMGSKAELEDIYSYAIYGSVNIFPEIKLFTAFADKGFSDYSVALDGESTKAKKHEQDNFSFEFSAVNSISDNTKSMLSYMRENDFEGVCLSDAGSVLYSDFSMGETTFRTETENILHDQINAVSAAKKLMTERGNLYAVKYASVITEIPEKAFYGENKNVSEIPFVQAVLHGFADYSLSPINLSENSTDAFLKCVEYGAVPYYEWYYADKGTEEEADKNYYMNSVADAQTGYERMKKTFYDLRTERITDHEEVKKNVFVTEYAGNTKIYVNYNEKAVTVSGVTIEGKSFLRVN